MPRRTSINGVNVRYKNTASEFSLFFETIDKNRLGTLEPFLKIYKRIAYYCLFFFLLPSDMSYVGVGIISLS